MRLYFLAFIIFTVVVASVRATEVSISMAQKKWPSDQRIEFSLYIIDADNDDPAEKLSDHVICILDDDGRTHTVTARRVAGHEDPGAGKIRGVAKALYAFDPPNGISGAVQMHIPEIMVPTILFDVVSSEDAPATGGPYPTLDTLFTLYQPYLGNISAYEPTYFLVGTDPEKSKFQLSFKYRFFNPKSAFVANYPWVKGFHLGYTQTSFWNLKSDSQPFEDTTYKPELFWVSKNFVPGGSSVRGMFFQSGLRHESNGRDGESSRSTNYLYAKPIFIFFSEGSRYGFQVAPKIWAYVENDDDTNPDLDDYRGYFDLEIKFGKADSFVIGSSFRWAKEGASVQLDLTYPLHMSFFKPLDIYLHAQYADALAENLIHYKDRTRAFRLGFSIVR